MSAQTGPTHGDWVTFRLGVGAETLLLNPLLMLGRSLPQTNSGGLVTTTTSFSKIETIAFLTLGFLVGHLAGLGAQGIGKSLVAALFAFGGGSALGLIHKLNPLDRQFLVRGLLVLCLGCILGTYTGILVNEYQVLTPTSLRFQQVEKRDSYLRTNLLSGAHLVDQQYRKNEISPTEAYERLHSLLTAVR